MSREFLISLNTLSPLWLRVDQSKNVSISMQKA